MNILMKTLILGTTAFTIFVSSAQADIVVQWGDVTANVPTATDIVAGNQSLSATTTYSTAINPTVGAGYYPSATGHSPIFNGAASKNGINTAVDTAQIQTNVNHDRIRFVGTSATQLTGMVAWDSFLTTANTLESLSISSFSTNAANVNVQFIFQDSNDDWFASDAGVQGGGGNNFKTIADVSAATWTTFDTLSAGVGGPTATGATPNFVDFKSVGYYFEGSLGTAGTIGMQTGYFQATAVPEPSSLAMLGLLGLGLFRRKRS